MSNLDIFKMAFHNLWRRKSRTALNLIGVVIGCVMLMMTAAGATGVKSAIILLFDQSEDTRNIQIYKGGESIQDVPDEAVQVEGEMSDERRKRIEKRLKRRWLAKKKRMGDQEDFLTPEMIKQITSIENVKEVVPESNFRCLGEFEGGQKKMLRGFGVGDDSTSFADQIFVGRPIANEGRDEIVVGEFFAYELGFRSDADLQRLLGHKVKLTFDQRQGEVVSMLFHAANQANSESNSAVTNFQNQIAFISAFMKLMSELDSTSLTEKQKKLVRSVVDSITKKEQNKIDRAKEDAQRSEEKLTSIELVEKEFEIVGVFHRQQKNSIFAFLRRMFFGHGEVAFHNQTAQKLYVQNSMDPFYFSAACRVTSSSKLQQVTDDLEAMGLETGSALPVLNGINEQIDKTSWIFYGLAGVILAVSSIGIFNTLVISVLERTPEFGIMKSLGARNTDVMKLMIGEGVMLGVVGSGVALLISYLLSVFGHHLLKAYVESRISETLPETNFFRFTSVPILLAALLAIAVCVLASIVPAWRASRLDPVVAMKRK